ncbi:lipase [Aspergillus unguis]
MSALIIVSIPLVLLAIFFHSIFPLSNSGTVQVTDQNDITYIGTLSSSRVEHFQNIFYAEPPTGSLRFAPPIPKFHRKGSVIDATAPGAWCPQGLGDILPFTSPVTNISEDCLSLRIARAGTNANVKEKVPVVVWIHGGGHALGSASDVLYEPDGLVRLAADEDRPVVYAGINYRLGFFGFATSKALVERKETNAGLRDQRAALHWIRDNIAAFGGDPERVTVIGQSVGACDIGLHMLASDGKDIPFQRAIMMSGSPGVNFNVHPDLVTANTASIASQAGCTDKNKDSQNTETVECLRQVPFETLANLSVSASRAARPPFGEGFFYPTIDGDFLVDRPSKLLREGKVARGVKVIASWVTNDGAWYAMPNIASDEEVLGSFGRWVHGLSESTKTRLLELYPVSDFAHMLSQSQSPSSEGALAQYYRAAQMSRDIWFTCPVLDFTFQYAKHGGDASDIRLYEFNQTKYRPVFEQMGVSIWGVAHLSDIPYLFNNEGLRGCEDSEGHKELGREFSRAVVNFAYELEDKPKESKSWPAAFEETTGASPEQISLRVFGGLSGGGFGAGDVTIRKDEPGPLTHADEAVSWEKLFARCEFINSAQYRAEAGV